MRKDEFAVRLQVGIVNFVWICAVPAWLQLRDAMLSPPHHHHAGCPHAGASPTHPLSRGWLPCQFPVGMWVPALIRNKAPEKSKCYKKMQNPISKSLSHCSIKVLHVIPFIRVYLKCAECCLWKELEALQHQRSVGMHPLSEHTLTPRHTQKHQIGRTRLLAIAHLIFDKNQRSLWNRIFRNFIRSNGFRLFCILVTWCSKCPEYHKGVEMVVFNV